MPIVRHLQGFDFDPETIKIITIAYEKVCRELQLIDRNDPLTEFVTKEIIAVAQTGERDSNRIAQNAMQKLGARSDK